MVIQAACLAQVTDPSHVVSALESIESTVPLPERLVAIIETPRAQGERTGAIRPRSHESMPEEERTHLSESRDSSYTSLHATLILAIVLALGRGGSWDAGIAGVTTDGLADLILHGITADPHSATEPTSRP